MRVNRSILIVEDDETVAELLAFTFRRGGFEPTIMRDGRAAAAYVAEHAPTDAVLLDVMLPCRDGYAVAAEMRQDPRWKAVPVIMLTGHSSREEADSRSLNIQGFFEKPFRPLALLRAVTDVLRGAAAA